LRLPCDSFASSRLRVSQPFSVFCAREAAKQAGVVRLRQLRCKLCRGWPSGSHDVRTFRAILSRLRVSQPFSVFFAREAAKPRSRLLWCCCGSHVASCAVAGRVDRMMFAPSVRFFRVFASSRLRVSQPFIVFFCTRSREAGWVVLLRGCLACWASAGRVDRMMFARSVRCFRVFASSREAAVHCVFCTRSREAAKQVGWCY